MGKDFKIVPSEFDRVLWQALAETYSSTPRFDNESSLKCELFHQLHGLEVSGHKLGDKLPGHPTCMLHAEARPQKLHLGDTGLACALPGVDASDLAADRSLLPLLANRVTETQDCFLPVQASSALRLSGSARRPAFSVLRL